MSISFSGLASGMDTSSWVEALVSVKQAEISKFETKKATIAAAQDTLSSIRNYFSSFQSLLQNITDAHLGVAEIDLFSQNLAVSSNLSALSAIATTAAENTTYNIEVNKLATSTEVNSGITRYVTTTVSSTATSDTKLFDLCIDEENPEPPLHAGNITFKIDGNDRSVYVDETTTITEFIDKLYSIGIDASYNENTGIFSINTDAVYVENVSTRALISDETGGIMERLRLEDVNYGYKTGQIDVITTITTPETATIDSKLEHFGAVSNADCAFKITKNDGTVVNVTTFTPESRLSEVFNVLKNTYQINNQIADDGTITLTSDKFGNVFGGKLAELMGFVTTEDPYISLSKMTSTDIVYTTKETLINRDATLGQIGAYKNGNDKLIIRKCDGGGTETTIASGTVVTLSASNTVTLNADTTVQDFFNILAHYGITASLNDGIISLNSTTGNFIDGSIATNMGILKPVVNEYTTTAPIVMTSSTNINTSSSLGGLGMTSDGSVVIYSPVYGIVSVNVNKELTVSEFCQRINDSNYGLKAEISGSKVKISELSGSGAYITGMSSTLQSALKLNVGEDNSFNSTTISVYANTDSTYIKYNDTAVELNSNSTISSINGYTHGNGKILLHQNGEVSTIVVDQTLTLDEFFNNPIIGLAQYDLSGTVLSDGKAYITADADIYLEQISGGSNILSALKLSSLSQTTSGQHALESPRLSSTVRVTTTVAATNSTHLASLNDGVGANPTWFNEGSLVFKVNDYYKTVNLTDDDTFESLIGKLKDVGIDAYITRGQFYIASGYNNVEYVNNESTSNLLRIIGLSGPQNLGGYSASSSSVKSKIINTEEQKLSATNYASNSTKLSTVSITSGSLTVYRNGQRANIEIADDDDFAALQTNLNQAFSTRDLYIDFDSNNYLRDGKLKIYAKNSDGTINQDVKISIGSTSDKSNFVAITGISLNDQNQLESSRQLYKVNDKTALIDGNNAKGLFKKLGSDGKITAGSFKVGNANIYVNEGTTMQDIVAQINTSEDSLATAYWDNIEGKLVIRSTHTGASAVNIEAGDTNLTEVLGLTNEGNLVLDNQAIGSNAVLTINGTKYTSLSNNVTSDSTGITGLTINLKGLTNGSAVTLNVKRDTETLANAISNVLDRYNELIENVDAAIAKTGNLHDQTMLRLLRNNIKTALTSSDPGTTTFRNLAQIGIKASAESNASNISTSNEDITFLSLDKEEFLKAFEGNEEEIKALLVGSDFNEGIFTKVEKLVEGAMEGGYFTVATKAFSKDAENINKKILNGTLAIEKYRQRLEHKFSAMDIMIAGLQNQFKSFLG